MGQYTDRLARRIKDRRGSVTGRKSSDRRDPPATGVERLISVAIIRNDQTHSGPTSHQELRRSMGDRNPSEPLRGDRDGFLTSAGRFVDREEAKMVGEESGQTMPQQRPLLSSDINWTR